MDRAILHVDMNNFYASVESIAHPEYRLVPMAVAGDKASRHGIILAKNMLAKEKGVKTAEPIWQAQRKCPGLVLVEPHHDLYDLYSQKARELYYRYTDRVESFGLDECWLDVTGSRRLFGSGEEIAHRIREQVKEELGLTVSVGVSFNKIFAKLGSDYKKPDAVTVFGRREMERIIWKLPVGDLLFVGPKTGKTLDKFGITTIGQVAQAGDKAMEAMLGKSGEMLWRYASGLDDSPVTLVGQEEGVKTVGNSMTLPRDITNEEEIKCAFLTLAESVAARLRKLGLKAEEVQITVKNGEFEEYQRQCKLEAPVWDSRSLYQMALTLYRRENKKWAVRLLGLRAGKLTDGEQEQVSFFGQDKGQQREEKLEQAMDAVRSRYGKESLNRALMMKKSEEKHREPF